MDLAGLEVLVLNKGDSMKYVLSIVLLISLIGCSHGSETVRVRDCVPVGNGIYDCGVLTHQDFERNSQRR